MNLIQERIETFKVMNSPVRIRIINILLQRTGCNVTTLATVVNTIAQTGISRILQDLRMLDLVSYQKQSNNRYYQLTDKGRRTFAVHLSDILSEDIFQQDLKKLDNLN